MFKASTILLVDDSPVVRACVGQQLRFAGYEVIESTHVEEAVGT